MLAAQKASYGVDCIKSSIVSRSGKVICHLCSRETPRGSCIQLRGSRYEKVMKLLEGVCRKVVKTIREMEHLCYDERLRELFNLEKAPRTPYCGLSICKKGL